MKILVINSGSSSIKYRLFGMEDCATHASGLLERIGEANGRLTHHVHGGAGEYRPWVQERAVPDHRQGLAWIGEVMRASRVLQGLGELYAIGHRVVHGGETFKAPALVTDQVIEGIRRAAALAPLHNPANLLGIEVAREFAPEVPQVAVFDTAFHQTMPARAFLYALPYELYEGLGVRRYGFHGTSHHYVAKEAARFQGRPLESLDLITLHLGNGASAAAIRRGQSVDTSMGLTPLEGLVMGTRSGDLDPAIPFFLAQRTGKSLAEVEKLLNEASGLKGLCGRNDMREVLGLAEAGDPNGRLAAEVFCYRVRKYIGAYLAVLGRLDALVFTGGIGENSPAIRARCCEGLAGLGILVDPDRNEAAADGPCEIQPAGAAVQVLVIPTNEELEIARQTLEIIAG
ncbi:MAG: acetate kinase [Candidatus Rokubacteria bacterium]|nr:acetate kinase [Candidatus Rokubacteria bacterium]